MLFSQNRSELRRVYLEAFRKRREGSPMEPLEIQLADIIDLHPEYHRWLADDSALERDWSPELGESNPFLHMGLHLAVREQVATDRPIGIQALFRAQVARANDPHAVEHRFLECLAGLLFEAQRAGRAPDEQAYLDCLRAG